MKARRPYPHPRRRFAFAAAAFVAISVPGCALTGKADALSVRYFNPEVAKPKLTSSAAQAESPPPKEAAPLALELGRISSGSHLREKIVFRDAAFEVGYYDDKRWTERPEVFVRRELARTLFEERGFRRSLAGNAPVLDVEILAFEEVRKPALAARIQVRMIVHDALDSLVEKTMTVERPLPANNTSIDGLVQAMAEALNAVAEDVAKETEKAARRAVLAKAAAATTPPPPPPPTVK